MRAFFVISDLNIYIQIVVTLFSIGIHLLATRNSQRTETVLELVTIYTMGLAGWFSISSGLFSHTLFADQVAAGIGWPLNSGFQMELAFAAMGIGLVGAIGFWNRSFWLPFIIAQTTFMWGAGWKFLPQQYRHRGLLGYPATPDLDCPLHPLSTRACSKQI